jgi:hypothetical protein
MRVLTAVDIGLTCEVRNLPPNQNVGDAGQSHKSAIINTDTYL